MCIICNAGDSGSKFIRSFERASSVMEEATKAMLECSEVAGTPAQRRQYGVEHRKMVRLTKEWNKIEHTREVKTT